MARAETTYCTARLEFSICLQEIFHIHLLEIVGNQRFLYPQHQPGPVAGPSALVDDDDGLGPLPSGWERRVQPDGKYWRYNNFVTFTF